MQKKNFLHGSAIFLAGILNGLLGAGGGMLVVPILLKMGLSRKQAHATSVCIILPICILSALSYINSQAVSITDAKPFLLWGVVGSILGAVILKKINNKLLKNVFGILMIWAAVQLLIR